MACPFLLPLIRQNRRSLRYAQLSRAFNSLCPKQVRDRFRLPHRSGTYENSEKEDSPVRVPCYPFEKEEDGHNRSGHYLIRSPAGDCVRLYRILSLKWGTNATLREHVVIRFDQTAPGLFL